MHIFMLQLVYDGSTVEFHSAIDYSVDMATGGCSCTLGSWRSRADFMRGARPVIRRTFHFTATSEDVLASAYAAIVGSPQWAGAEIVP